MKRNMSNPTGRYRYKRHRTKEQQAQQTAQRSLYNEAMEELMDPINRELLRSMRALARQMGKDLYGDGS
jgi:hypothetical protein